MTQEERAFDLISMELTYCLGIDPAWKSCMIYYDCIRKKLKDINLKLQVYVEY